MTIEIINGCLLDAFDRGDVNIIGHVTNCQGVMGSGIAKSIRERYPKACREYQELFNAMTNNKDLLGHCQTVLMPMGKVIVNLHAQLDYGLPHRNLNYGAMGNCLWNMVDEMSTKDIAGFPYKMGSDRAGGDWNIVLEMIEFYFKDHQVRIYKI